MFVRFVQSASRIVAVTVLCLVAAGAARAQTGSIAGTVRDRDGVPLPGVNVYIEGTQTGAATDQQGHYRIPRVPPGTYTIVASAVGFRRSTYELTVTADHTTTQDFVLQEITVQSGELVVTASRRAELSTDAPLTIHTLLPRELEARNIVALDDALRYMPGVQLAGNQVSVRGSSGFSYNTGSRVLLLVDGLPMLRPDAEGIAFDAIPTSQIARIEVVKGPGSALYGGGALGGVVNVLTKDYPERPQTSMRSFAGVYEPVRYAAWRDAWPGAERPRPFGGVSVAHARRVGDRFGFWANLSYRSDAGYLRLNASETLQAFARAGWRPAPATRLDLLAGLTRRTSDAFLFWNGARDALNPGQLAISDAPGSQDNLTNELSLFPTFTHVPRPNLFYSVKGRIFGVIIQPLDEAKRPKPASDGTVGFRYGGEVQVDWQPGRRSHLTVGVSGDANATRSSFFDERDALSQPEGAVFAQWEQTLLHRVTLVTGLRFDTYRIRAGNVQRRLSPKLNVSLPLASGTTLRAGYGQGFRVPSVTERYVNDRSIFPVVANIELLPETSESYELGLRHLLPLPPLRAGALLDVAVFWNEYRRLVEPTFIREELAFQFINLTKARIRGVEATFDASDDEERWKLRLGYTYLDSRDLTADAPLVFRSRHLLKAALSTYVWGPFDAGLDFRYASRPERVDSDFARFVPDAETMVDTRVLDVRLGAQWRNLTVSLLARNALEYYYLERPAFLAPPRNYVLQLQALF